MKESMDFTRDSAIPSPSNARDSADSNRAQNPSVFRRIPAHFADIYHLYFVLFLVAYLAIIAFIVSGASVSHNEATLYLEAQSLTAKLAHISCGIFGTNDFALKAPNMAIFAANLTLIYLISRKILKTARDSLLCVAIYAAIPGVIMQGAIFNDYIIIFFVVLLICYIELFSSRILYPLCLALIFLGNSAFMFFLALFFYALSKKSPFMATFALVCTAANLYIFGIDVGGKPHGKFLDIIGELALLYSPPLFVYYIYTLYRTITKAQKSLLLYVSVCSIAISLLLSVRQAVDKEIFLYMSLCGIPLMIRQFLSDIRVRLPQFQNAYKRRFIVVLAFLIFEALLLIFSKSLYLVVENPQKSFLKSFYIAKELSAELKNRGISRVKMTDKSMQKRLEFYGIRDGGQPLREVGKNGNIIITYYGKIVARYVI